MPTYEIGRIPGEDNLSAAHAVRRAVFIDEQGVPEAIEMDENDDEAVHFVITDRESALAVGTARVRFPGPDVAKPERVAVRADYRGEGLGKRLMGLVESEARNQGCSRALVHAQVRVSAFYERLGYQAISDKFEQAGMAHVKMEKEI